MPSDTTTITTTNTAAKPFKTFLIAVSGPSSSGKTTLARLLRSIFNIPPSPATHSRSLSLFILHEDDFYKTDADIPVITTTANCPSGLGSRELQDWDSVSSLDLGLFKRTMEFVRQHGKVPDGSVSKEDLNSVGPTGIEHEAALLEKLKGEVTSWFSSLSTDILEAEAELRICILDGFLLYPSPNAHDPEMQGLRGITSLMDLKLFLPCSRKQTLQRRSNRSGYVTLEGFWEDPPGYVEDVVWPNYVRDHGWMLRGDGEEGMVDEEAAGREGIVVVPGEGRWGMKALLECEARRLMGVLDGLGSGER